MTTLHNDIVFKQSAVPGISYVIIDGVNCGTMDAIAINLRKPVSESRLAAIQAIHGRKQIIPPPPDIPEEYLY